MQKGGLPALTPVFTIILLLCGFAPSKLQAQSPSNVDYVGWLPYDVRLSDVWGYTDPTGREYALVGVLDGLSIVDLQDPANPVEVQFIPGKPSIWRDIKTWNDHAYITNETGGGLFIVDLTGLPGSVDTTSYRERELWTGHNIFIDENGIAYVVGANIDNGGATILDLNPDPKNPLFLGAYTDFYVHDLFAQGDTLYTAEISNGQLGIVDVSDKTNPFLLANQTTPIGLTHNSWLSPDGNTLAITEEFPGGHVVTYDVSDPADIRELGRYRSNLEVNVIPHNTFYVNDWLVTSSYVDGVTVVDASRPSNLVETGRFDTSPIPPVAEFGGCWGVYPYAPSGLIYATDIEEGLFILSPKYKRAAYLEGTVRESTSGNPILYARIELLGSGSPDQITDFTGNYATGTVDSGSYTVRVSASGCPSQLFPDVNLVSGQVTTLDPFLSCTSVAVVDPGLPSIQLDITPAAFRGSTQLQYNLQAEPDENPALEVFDPRGHRIERFSLTGLSGSVSLGEAWAAGYYILKISGLGTPGQDSRTIRVVKLH